MMNATSKSRAVLAAAAIAAIGGSLTAAPAVAQMFNEPFSFTDRSPEAMAIFMRNRDDRNSNGGTIAAGADSGETLVCAGTGANTATSAGNIMCVLAGSGANVLVGSEQDSEGDQTSDAEANTTTGDEISEILYGDDNSSQ